MTTYAETISYLFGLQKFGIKLGLSNITELLAVLGNPHQAYPAVHIAGTNGKGSTAAFLASILQEAGYRTALYTSPHLVDFTERIRVDGETITADAVAEYTALLRPDVDRLNATFFEATTAMAFRYFFDRQADIAVIETGLGGRLDSTNVITPLASVITTIELDHIDILGASIEAIAAEKAGIIKPGVPVVAGAIVPAALQVLRRTAEAREAPLTVVSCGVRDVLLRDVDAMDFRLEADAAPVLYRSPVAGLHQARNAALAMATARVLVADAGMGGLEEAFEAGIRNVRANTGLRGRLERISRSPEIVIDAAHNPGGFRALLDVWLGLRCPSRTHIVIGLLATKDAAAIFRMLGGQPWASVTLADVRTGDGYTAADLAVIARDCGVRARIGGPVYETVTERAAALGDGESLLLCGSHYLLGEYLEASGRR